jgi:hypothetical protein
VGVLVMLTVGSHSSHIISESTYSTSPPPVPFTFLLAVTKIIALDLTEKLISL